MSQEQIDRWRKEGFRRHAKSMDKNLYWFARCAALINAFGYALMAMNEYLWLKWKKELWGKK